MPSRDVEAFIARWSADRPPGGDISQALLLERRTRNGLRQVSHEGAAGPERGGPVIILGVRHGIRKPRTPGTEDCMGPEISAHE